MSTPLTRRMFENARVFGIRSGTIRPSFTMKARKVSHNGRWYNKQGEYLGWGDLDSADLKSILQGMPEDEVFYVLPESAMFGENLQGRDRENIGVGYCVEKFVFAIFNGRVHLVDQWNLHEAGDTIMLGEGENGVEVFYIQREGMVQDFIKQPVFLQRKEG